MKSTGMTRAIDELGRIVIPKEIRRTLDINVRDMVEMYVDGSAIVMQKYIKGCSFCGETADIVEFGNKYMCKECVKKISLLKK